MKKIFTLLVSLAMVFAFTACSSNGGNADKGNDGMIQDAGDAVNDALDGAENVVDDVTGSDNNNNNNTDTNNNADGNSGNNQTTNTTNNK